MGAGRAQSNQDWRDEFRSLILATNQEISQVHGRIKRVESVVLGDEENDKIGLAEKFRVLESQTKAMDKKRAVYFTVIGWIAAALGNYVMKQILPEQPVQVSVMAEKKKKVDEPVSGMGQ